MIDMSNDSGLFLTREELEADGWRLGGNVFRREEGGRLRERLPLYEAKMVHQFDHRWATYDGEKTRDLTLAEKQDPNCVVLPRYWIDAREVWLRTANLPRDLLDALRTGIINNDVDSIVKDFALPLHDGDGAPADAEEYLKRCSPHWLMGWRDICRSTDERTFIGGIVPRAGVGHKFQLMIPVATSRSAAVLMGSCSSFVCDFTVRQKTGGTSLSYFTMKQVAVLAPDAYTEADFAFIVPRVIELVYTAWDLQPFAQDCGWNGPPFRWDEERRFMLRAELDAAFFHLYLPATPDGRWEPARREVGAQKTETTEQLAVLTKHFPTPRDAVAYVLETFSMVKRKDMQRYGEYRTKRVILDVYDTLQEARSSGRPYRTRLDPPPADARCRHPPGEAAT